METSATIERVLQETISAANQLAIEPQQPVPQQPEQQSFVTALASEPGILIAGEPSVSLAQMIEWSKGRGAAQFFIDLAPYYYEKGVKYGIDPAVAWVQTTLETGDGNFPEQWCILDASWKNTCGMKTTQGGSDSEPEAHFRFNTWKDSVDAQFDHLALYAGLEGFPKTAEETKDPRHFPWLFGTAKTMEDLKGKWASDPDYDTKLKTLINALRQTEVAEPSTARPVTQIVLAPGPSEREFSQEMGLSQTMLAPGLSERELGLEMGLSGFITDGTDPINTVMHELGVQIL